MSNVFCFFSYLYSLFLLLLFVFRATITRKTKYKKGVEMENQITLKNYIEHLTTLLDLPTTDNVQKNSKKI